jgi:phage/plasmid-like protein (TIGR03299 family)
MSHEIDLSNGRANIAYAGETPWHKLGFQINADASIEEWRKAAGLEWSVLKGEVMFHDEDGALHSGASLNRSVLYRSDTHAPLSVMSTSGYHVVQPDEILGFIGDTVKAMGWKMETAGSLKGGRKIWALANIGEEATLPGGDRVRGNLLAATACDGSMASEFLFTTTRVVCQNTMHMALQQGESQPRVKVYHYNALDINAVKAQLGIATTVWAQFVESAKMLASVRLSEKKAAKVLRSVYEKPAEKIVVGDEILTDDEWLKRNATPRRILELFAGDAMGADLLSSRFTAWGLANAATEYYDHAANARSVDNRLNSAWFGPGAQRKADVFDACLKMAA